MKNIFIVLSLVLLIGVGYMIWKSSTPTTTMTMSDGTIMTDAEHAAMMQQQTPTPTPTPEPTPAPQPPAILNSDAGMEFPTTDISVDANAKVFNVKGTGMKFDVGEIVVNEGDTVTINFVSANGFHDWVIDEFDAKTARVKPGDATTSVTFVADKKGSFEYYCSVASHRAMGMKGTLVVK